MELLLATLWRQRMKLKTPFGFFPSYFKGTQRSFTNSNSKSTHTQQPNFLIAL